MNIAFTSKREQFFNVNLFSIYRNEIKLLLPVQKWILYNLCCNMFLSETKLLLLLPTVAFILITGLILFVWVNFMQHKMVEVNEAQCWDVYYMEKVFHLSVMPLIGA